MHEERPCVFWRAKELPCLMCCAFIAERHGLELHMASN